MNQEIKSETVGNAIVQSSLGSMVAKVSGVLSSLIIFRSLDPATYGVWRLALALTALLLGWLTALTSVISVEAIRSLPEGEAKTGLVLWRGFVRITLACSIVMAGIGIIFAQPIATLIKVSDPQLVILALLLVIFWLLKSHAMSWLLISYQFREQLRLQIIESSAYLALLVLFLLVRGGGAKGLGMANVGAACLISLVSIPILLRGLRACPTSSWMHEVKSVFHLLRQHGKWALGFDILKDNLDAGRIWLIAYFLGPTAVGLYGLADSLLGHLTSFVNIGPAVTSSLSRLISDRTRLPGAMAHAARVGTLTSLGVFVFSFISVSLIIPWLFPKFAPAIPLYYILSFAIFVVGIGVVLNTIYPALRQQKTIFFLLAIRIVASFTFLVIFLPRIGIWAIGIEVLFGNYLFVWMRFRQMRKLLSINQSFWNFCFPRKGDVIEVQTFLRNKLLSYKMRFLP